VTEQDWMRCTDPKEMLGLLKWRANDRQVRLLLCACGRTIWGQLPDGRGRNAVEASERFADEPGDEDTLVAAYREAAAALREAQADETDRYRDPVPPARAEAAAICLELVDRWVGVGTAVALAGQAIPQRSLAELLREIFHPFRPVTVEAAWLAWHGGAAVKLAEAVYEERHLPSGHLDAVRLAILADMLEEAGATDQHLLGHLRSPGPHVRGCWALDALLAKD
jgi:hypothetical protein